MLTVHFRLTGGSSVGCFGSPAEANLFEREFGLEAQLTNVSPLAFAGRAASQ